MIRLVKLVRTFLWITRLCFWPDTTFCTDFPVWPFLTHDLSPSWKEKRQSVLDPSWESSVQAVIQYVYVCVCVCWSHVSRVLNAATTHKIFHSMHPFFFLASGLWRGIQHHCCRAPPTSSIKEYSRTAQRLVIPFQPLLLYMCTVRELCTEFSQSMNALLHWTMLCSV